MKKNSSYAQLMYVLKQNVPWDLRVLRQVTKLPTLFALENLSFLIKFLISSLLKAFRVVTTIAPRFLMSS
jgi:hypothetical protein